MSAVRKVGTQASVEPAASPNGAHFELENGARADQRTFHAWYKTTPEGFKAELIDGVVFVGSPVWFRHGRPHGSVAFLLGTYAASTPGIALVDNTTAILSDQSEPQPDCVLLVDAKWGGQSTVDDEGYLVGAPELVVEVANSSASIDMHRKRFDYERAGVREYVVLLIRDGQVKWLISREGRFEDFPLMPDGAYRSRVFPGLWVHAEALLRHDLPALNASLRAGLASPEHAEFVALMETRRPKSQ